jgi:hypothetical protein
VREHDKELHDCVIRDPHFDIRYEIGRFAAITSVFMIVFTAVASLIPGPRLGSTPIAALILLYFVSRYVTRSVNRIVGQWQYRRGKYTKHTTVLEQSDAWWHVVASHASRLQGIAEVISKGGEAGHDLHDILLANLSAIDEQRLRIKAGQGSQQDLDDVGASARQTAHELAIRFAAHETEMGQRA